MPAASQDAMAELHSLLAQKFKKILAGGEPSAAELGVIAKFLKDNGIEADPGANKDLQNLLEDIPEFDDEEAYPE